MTKIAEDKKVLLNYGHLFTKVDHKNKIAFVEHDKKEIKVNYDFLHVCPFQTAPKALKESSIVDQDGFVTVDQHTLRHTKYENIWSLGDCSNLLTSKTATAVIDQSPVLVHNLIKSLDKARLNASYTGYTACPVYVGGGKGLLLEFKYEGIPDHTYSKNLQNHPTRLAYFIAKEVFPIAY